MTERQGARSAGPRGRRGAGSSVGIGQGLLRSDGPLLRLAARAYAWSLRDFFYAAVDGIDLGRGRLLDVGCGPGDVTARLAGVDRQVVGCDLSLPMLRRARRLAPSIAWVTSDAMALPFADGSFDTVLTIASLKFWPDPERGVAELARVLRPGGKAVVVELDRDATDADLDGLLDGVRMPGVPRRLVRAVMRGRFLSQAKTAAELEELAARYFSSTEVSRVAGLPFARMAAHGSHPP